MSFVEWPESSAFLDAVLRFIWPNEKDDLANIA
jgi:hypothetical protein